MESRLNGTTKFKPIDQQTHHNIVRHFRATLVISLTAQNSTYYQSGTVMSSDIVVSILGK